MASGSPVNFITSGTRLWNQAQLPETTRNQLARLLMMRGPQAETDVFAMEAVARKLAERRARRAAGIGGVGGASATSATQNR
jgi:hypothetical protein